MSRHISASLSQQLVSSLPGLSGTARLLDRATTIAQSGWLQTKCLQVTAETSSRHSVSRYATASLGRAALSDSMAHKIVAYAYSVRLYGDLI